MLSLYITALFDWSLNLEKLKYCVFTLQLFFTAILLLYYTLPHSSYCLSTGFTEERPMVMASKASNIIRLIGDAKNIDCQYVRDGDDRVTYIGN